MGDVVVCSNCKERTLKIMWNLTVLLVDRDAELICRINDSITTNLLQLSPEQSIFTFYKDYEALKFFILDKLNYTHGVFKIISKPSRQGKRYYNIV